MKSDEYWKILENRPKFYAQKIPSLVGFESVLNLDESGETLRRKIGKSASVLELGSGNNALLEKLKKRGHGGTYHTMDIETRFPHDFHSLDEIKQNYDFILMLEMVEHMPLDVFFQYLDFCEKHLNPGGTIVISTPNAGHLNQVWKHDMTHIRPYPLRDLFALFTARGFATEMYRIHLVEENYGLLRWIRRRIAQVLAWLLYAQIEEGIMIFASKSGGNGGSIISSDKTVRL